MTWTGQDWGLERPRIVTDLIRDGCADIVGVSNEGAWVALNKGYSTLHNPDWF